MTTRTDYHCDTGREFLGRARAYFDEGDLLQASEKGWGATAHLVKAAAEARGWRHNSHRDLHVTIDRLSEETGDAQLRDLFIAATALHTNFYEGLMPRRNVASGLNQVAELVEKLEALAA